MHELTRKESIPMEEIVERAVDHYWREQMLRAANRAYDALRADARNWGEYQQELAVWNVALRDGLED
jgi:hypothetical protein